MNLPGWDEMGQLSMLYLIGYAVLKIGEVEPHTRVIRDTITTGKKIIEFVCEIPEWKNYDTLLRGYLESLRHKKRQLDDAEKDLIDELTTTERRTNWKRKREVESWLRNVRAKADDVNRTEEEIQRRNLVFGFLLRALFGKRVKMEEADIDELIRQKEALGRRFELVLEPKGTIQHRMVTGVLVGKSSSEKRLQIWTTLLKQTTRIVGIRGEQGMGKSTMMANIYNLEVAYSGLFDRAFYITISRGDGLHQLQAAIGEAIDLDNFASISNVRTRASKIREALDKYSSFLMILDGLCEYFRLTDVGIPFFDQEDSGKLVVISPYQSVCRAMNCDKTITLERLPEDEAGELFIKTLGSQTQLTRRIQGVASEIIRQCSGVPEKIVNTAESLRGVADILEWRQKSRELAMVR